MDRLPYTYLLIFYCLTFVCIYGRGQDSFPSCEVQVMVRSGMIKKAAPQQRLTVRCPVKHCGESLNVTWCKLLETNTCGQINQTEDVEITQDDKHAPDRLVSSLTFKRISIHDDGLYKCTLGDIQIGHFINVSISDGELDLSWLPYFYICISAVLLVATFSVFTLLRFYGWRHSSPSCDVGVMVRRGTTKKAAAQQCLTVECPVKHCGESVNVTWCKLLETNQWEQINQTEDVEITQGDKSVDRLTSFLTFKRISIHDDGLYRCNLFTGDIQTGYVSHIINITVSGRTRLLIRCLTPPRRVMHLFLKDTDCPTPAVRPSQPSPEDQRETVTVDEVSDHAGCGGVTEQMWFRYRDTVRTFNKNRVCRPIEACHNIFTLYRDDDDDDDAGKQFCRSSFSFWSHLKDYSAEEGRRRWKSAL
ncbi:B- and T-lymphocyte attenuator [Collichthys lucidus]|uniref:B-and T-lymphocyte attenuator n=1 Tax=Collichthys lucidus TaxID=240159 RepID=A0A4U5TZA9_COLLU|nr:B- and T-lymphocyte attenuator [Collichthys lucidus]